MVKHNKKKSTLLLIVVMPNLALPYAARAEGGDRRPGGDYGINRRIRSKDNYVGVEATFTASFDQPKKYNPKVQSYPSFYLGGRGTAQAGGEREVDAGLQFDPTPPNDYPKGWTAIISVNSVQINPRIWDAADGWVAWRGPADRAYTLKYIVETDGKLRLDVSGGLGSFYWVQKSGDSNGDDTPDNVPDGRTLNDGTTPAPNIGYNTWPWQSRGEVVMNPANFNSHSVKRVIAITQEAPNEGYLDGTVMTCKVIGAEIYPTGSPTSVNWNADRTNQAGVTEGTGYDAPKDLADPRAWDRLKGSKVAYGARPKVTFPEVDQKNKVPATDAEVKDRRNPIARTNRTSSHEVTQGGVTRYGVETVTLSLRAITNPKTKPYRVKGR